MSAAATGCLRRRILHTLAGAAIILSVVGVVMWRWLGSFDAAWALVRGDDAIVLPSRVDLGPCAEGDVKELQLRVVNMSSSPITLTGVYTSCSCIVVNSLPATIEARASFSLHLTIHSPEEPGPFARRAVIYTNSKVSPQLPIALLGQTIGGGAPPATDVTTEQRSIESPAAPEDSSEPTAVLPSPREPDLASSPTTN